MLDIDFPDREYELGGLIDVSIIVTPDRDATIRSARVDLVCNQTYTHHSEWEGSAPVTVARARYGASTSPALDFAGGMKVDQRTESYVHSTVTTLKDALFRADVTETRRVDLRSRPDAAKALANRGGRSRAQRRGRLEVCLDAVRLAGRSPWPRPKSRARRQGQAAPAPCRNIQRQAEHVQTQAPHRPGLIAGASSSHNLGVLSVWERWAQLTTVSFPRSPSFRHLSRNPVPGGCTQTGWLWASRPPLSALIWRHHSELV